jgi:hypothetical protein
MSPLVRLCEVFRASPRTRPQVIKLDAINGRDRFTAPQEAILPGKAGLPFQAGCDGVIQRIAIRPWIFAMRSKVANPLTNLVVDIVQETPR